MEDVVGREVQLKSVCASRQLYCRNRVTVKAEEAIVNANSVWLKVQYLGLKLLNQTIGVCRGQPLWALGRGVDLGQLLGGEGGADGV